MAGGKKWKWLLFGGWYGNDSQVTEFIPLSMNVDGEDAESTVNYDGSASQGLNERFGFMAPYSGRVLQIMTRCESGVCDNSKWHIVKAVNSTELPVTAVGTSATVDLPANTATVYPFDAAEITAGDILSFKFDPGGATSTTFGDTNFTIVFEFDY